MGYNQFIQLQIKTTSSKRTYQIKNTNLIWGKFYKNPNKGDDMTKEEVEKLTISANNAPIVASCGRSDTSSGTEGSLELWQDGTRIGTIHWDNPWLTGKSNSVWADLDPNAKNEWIIGIGSYPTSGASIGFVEATVAHTD